MPDTTGDMVAQYMWHMAHQTFALNKKKKKKKELIDLIRNLRK